MAKRSSWKNERASVSRGASRPRSNKFSSSDETRRPAAGTRSRVWVAGYTRGDGTEVAGHFRQLRSGAATGGRGRAKGSGVRAAKKGSRVATSGSRRGAGSRSRPTARGRSR